MIRPILIMSSLAMAACSTVKEPSWLGSLEPDEKRIMVAMKEAVGTYGFFEGPLTIKEIEEHPTDIFKSVDPNSQGWVKFKENKREGYEVYYMETSQESWDHLMGIAGYFIVDGNRGIDFYETIRN